MAPYDSWNRLDDSDDEELADTSYFEGKRDVILFCIDASPSMLELYPDPQYEEEETVMTCHLYTALEAAMMVQKKKVIVGPNDFVGILLFNTTRKSASKSQISEIKAGTFLYQAIGPISAPSIQEIIRELDTFREDSSHFSTTFPPLSAKPVPMGDVFTSCNWVLRDGAPKTASKRVFLITDTDDPHAGIGSKQLFVSARTTLVDLTQAGVTIEPFFISTASKPFDLSKFYGTVLPTHPSSEDIDSEDETSILPEEISITRIGDLLGQMLFREVPKRALFSVPFQLANGLVIGIKGYGLVTEQKKGTYKYFVDTGDGMEVANVRTVYVDEDQHAEVDKSKLLYGMSLGATAATAEEDEDEAGDGGGGFGTRVVNVGQRPFYTAEDIKKFRTLGLEPVIKLLGFKDKSELVFEDNIKHSYFIYPDEMRYSGSKRTFSALLKSMIKKDKIGLVLTLMRRNSSPLFCALVPQAEKVDEGGWNEPPGFHLIPFPFADDIRSAPVQEGFRTSEDLKEAAFAWIAKLNIKNGGYPPDSYPNPSLAFHNAQLEASAFREEYDPETFEDMTEPKIDMMHKRAGKLMQVWKDLLREDPTANVVVVNAGSKRKADVSVDEAEIRSKYESGTLAKLRVDQLKEFLKNKSQSVSGKKGDLVERVADWLDSH